MQILMSKGLVVPNQTLAMVGGHQSEMGKRDQDGELEGQKGHLTSSKRLSPLWKRSTLNHFSYSCVNWSEETPISLPILWVGWRGCSQEDQWNIVRELKN